MIILASKQPIHSLEPTKDWGLSFTSTNTRWISCNDGTIELLQWLLDTTHEQRDCNVRYPQPQPYVVN